MMDVSVRFLNNNYYLLMLIFGVSVSCSEQLPSITGTTSIRMNIHTPMDWGTAADRLDESPSEIEISMAMIKSDGEIDVSFEGSIDLYSYFLGSLTPSRNVVEPDCLWQGAWWCSSELNEVVMPLCRVTLSEGSHFSNAVGNCQIKNDTRLVVTVLSPMYGHSLLWAEHVYDKNATYATGTSESLWIRSPYLQEISKPYDEDSQTALERSPLENKQINVTQSRYGDTGHLIVTGVYPDRYTLSDINCPQEGSTCQTGAYDSIVVYSFNQARDEFGNSLKVGHIVSRLTGAVMEFIGLTELSFPQTFLEDQTPRADKVPEPASIRSDWLRYPPSQQNLIELEKLEASLVSVEGVVCNFDNEYVKADFEEYGQWKVDVGQGCRNAVNIISYGQAPDFDPQAHQNEQIKIIGTLQPVNIGQFHVWIVHPRNRDDIQQ